MVFVLILGSPVLAYNQRPGSWPGWLVADPWGSMYLYNHCHIYPVSQEIVPNLKKYAGKPSVIDVKKTFALFTPGPVRIEKAEYDRSASFGELKGLSLTAAMGTPTVDNKNPNLTLKIKNKTKEKVRFIAAQLSLIVLVRGKSKLFTATNGHSYPHNFYSGRWIRSFDIIRETGRVRIRSMTSYDTLNPGEEYSCTVELKLAPGEYYAWGGYGASKYFGPISLMSNGVGFEVPKFVSSKKEKKRIEELINIVEDDTPKKTKWQKVRKAIRELGNLRAIEAIDVLIEKLDWNISVYLVSDDSPSREDKFPAIKALILIRQPAIQPIIKAVATKARSDKFISNAAYTIHAITGETKAKTQERIKQILNTYQKRLDILIDKVPKGINRRYIPIVGRVISIERDTQTENSQLVTLNVGRKQGVKKGYEFIIYREKLYICAIVIKKVNDESATGLIIPESVNKEKDGKPRTIKINDKVSTQAF